MNLDEIEALLAKATKGPWSEGDPAITGELAIRSVVPVYATTNVVCRPTHPRDAALIVALRNAAPSLLAAAREAGRLRVALKASAEDLRHFENEHTYGGVSMTGEELREYAQRARSAADAALAVKAEA